MIVRPEPVASNRQSADPARHDGGFDPMHFELAEGRKFLESHGAEAVVAGADLRAREEAEEEARKNWGP